MFNLLDPKSQLLILRSQLLAFLFKFIFLATFLDNSYYLIKNLIRSVLIIFLNHLFHPVHVSFVLLLQLL